MSLSTRVIGGIGAVVVIAAGTLAGSLAYADSEGKPDEHVATLTVGRSSITSKPFCYNDGKPLDQAMVTKCRAGLSKARENGKIATSDVVSSDRIGVGVPTSAADHGWFAVTDGGAQEQAILTANAIGTTWSGSTSAANVLNGSGSTTVTVVESSEKSNELYAIWYFDLKQKD